MAYEGSYINSVDLLPMQHQKLQLQYLNSKSPIDLTPPTINLTHPYLEGVSLRVNVDRRLVSMVDILEYATTNRHLFIAQPTLYLK